MVENGNDLPSFMNMGGEEKKETPKKEIKKEFPKEEEKEVVKNDSSEEINALKKQLEEQSRQFEELKKMIAQSSNIGGSNSLSQAAIIAEVLKSVRKQDYEIKQAEENAQIDPDDYLEKPIVYYCYATLFGLGSDKRRGKEVLPPNGTVIFKLYHTKVIQDGKGQGVINYATYVCHSKKENAWLESHSLFGIKFFKWDNISDKTNPEKAKKFIKFAEALNNYQPMQLKDLCLQNGISFNPDQLDQAKFELIMKMTEDELAREMKSNDVTFNQQLMMDKERFKKDYELYNQIAK